MPDSQFRGLLTALITPMADDGSVDEDALARLVEAQIAGGVDGLVPCGTTGEAATLSHEEHIRVVEIVTRTAAGRVPVLAGAGSNSTREAIELASACKQLGVAGTLQVVPYYNKPPQEGLILHFEAIADAVDLPIILYNIPGRSVINMVPETVARLARHPNIVGIKDATSDMHVAALLRELCGEDFTLLSGDDFTLLPFLATGGDGVISVVSNPAPALVRALIDAFAAGELAEARRLHHQQLALTRLLFREPNPIAVKLTMHLLGRSGLEVRAPLRPLTSDCELAQTIQATLQQLALT
ncbi:MAG: 4-hydroxy-tetrahydrodipicolinate synthase [Enhygromyxa sp.]